MIDIPQDGLGAPAREAFAAIEAVLDHRCPEMKVAFWTAVELLYRLDSPLNASPRETPGPNPDVPAQAQTKSGMP